MMTDLLGATSGIVLESRNPFTYGATSNRRVRYFLLSSLLNQVALQPGKHLSSCSHDNEYLADDQIGK